MRRISQIVIGLTAVAHAALVYAHGHPIIVTASDSRLLVSGGVLGTDVGFAGQIFVETDSTGDPQDFADFANFGPAIYWNVPGFNISGLTENSGLYLQTLVRPVKNASPIESRGLWYWNPNSIEDDKVEPAPTASRMQIRQDATVNMLLTPTTTVAPPQMKIAAPVAADMNFHNHDLVKYLLPAPLPDDGAYGFFARLTSDIYAPSDPFLVVINNGGLSGTEMLEGAAAINRDALLAGDYNHNDVVDAADYVIWRKTLNSATKLAADGSGNGTVDADDFGVWRGNFGSVYVGSALSSAIVPEPQSFLHTVATIVGCCLTFGRSIRSTRR